MEVYLPFGAQDRSITFGTVQQMSKSATDFSISDETYDSTASPVGGESLDEKGGVFADFKDTQGRFRTQSLFWESRHPDYTPYFTTKKFPHEGCISMYQKYMEIGDPTEWRFAQRVLGSWDHWKALCASKWFNELVTEWREELRIKMESDRYWEMKHVQETAGSDSPQAIQATKWLADRYGKTESPKRGRPSNDEKRAHLKSVKEFDDTTRRDALRLGLLDK